VRRGPLEIKITERGSLDSASNVTLVSKVEGSTTIISIVPEGTAAYAGQVLVELDSSSLRNQEIQQQIVLEQAEAALKQAIETLAIQKTQNESDIAAADLQLTLAELDLKMYKEGQYVQEKSLIEGEIKLAEEDLTRARDKEEFSRRLSKKGYVSQTELEADRIAVKKAQIALDVALQKMRVLEDFTYQRQVAEKEANAVEFKRELERTKRKADAALAQAEANVSACKLTAEVERAKMEKLRAQIAACTIRAPQAGEVVYANMSDRRGNQEAVIEEGTQVRERQAIINLPDYSKMQVNSRIHESRIGMLRTGLRAYVRVDASPGEVFNGVVDSVSSVPLSGSWPNRDLKEYAAVIRLTDPVEKLKQLKPGLTAEVEIEVDRISSALQVPVQSALEVGGQHYVFAVVDGQPQLRKVRIGRTNDIMLQILEDGSELKEGEKVILNPRSAVSDQVLALEESALQNDSDSADSTEQAVSTGTPGAAENSAVPPGPGQKGPGEAPPAGGPQPPEGGPQEGRGPGRGPGGDPMAFFQRLDANSDGKLTLDELPERLQGRFGTLDANGDQSIDADEWKSGMQQFGRPGAAGGPAATEVSDTARR